MVMIVAQLGSFVFLSYSNLSMISEFRFILQTRTGLSRIKALSCTCKCVVSRQVLLIYRDLRFVACCFFRVFKFELIIDLLRLHFGQVGTGLIIFRAEGWRVCRSAFNCDVREKTFLRACPWERIQKSTLCWVEWGYFLTIELGGSMAYYLDKRLVRKRYNCERTAF